MPKENKKASAPRYQVLHL